jgi:homoserine O-succinyltransferase/O-acetyltransferase
MTIVVPKNYHATKALMESRILCIDQEQAARENIRALRIGILNIMPQADRYEFSLLHPLGRSVLQIEPIWIKLKNHQYNSTDHKHLEGLYYYFDDVIKHFPLDGMILTGAPVEDKSFEDVIYWEEVKQILLYAREHVYSVLGICWGGMALAKLLGIEKTLFHKKIFGAFETLNLDRQHPVMGDHEDIFWCPQSRHAGINDNIMLNEAMKGTIHLLAYSKEAGYTIFESSDQKFIMHLGHPEYEASRLIDEYHRDLAEGRKDVAPPANIDIKNPLNRWRGHRNEFFGQWIKFVHEKTNALSQIMQ